MPAEVQRRRGGCGPPISAVGIGYPRCRGELLDPGTRPAATIAFHQDLQVEPEQVTDVLIGALFRITPHDELLPLGRRERPLAQQVLEGRLEILIPVPMAGIGERENAFMIARQGEAQDMAAVLVFFPLTQPF